MFIRIDLLICIQKWVNLACKSTPFLEFDTKIGLGKALHYFILSPWVTHAVITLHQLIQRPPYGVSRNGYTKDGNSPEQGSSDKNLRLPGKHR